MRGFRVNGSCPRRRSCEITVRVQATPGTELDMRKVVGGFLSLDGVTAATGDWRWTRSVFEELLQHGSQGFGGNVMRLTFQGTSLPLREGLGERLHRLLEEREARATANH